MQQEHLHSRARWARITLAALSVVGLFGVAAISGCVNGESIEAPSHEGSAAEDSGAALRARPGAIPSLKASIPAAGDVLIAGGADASNRSLASAEFFDPASGQFVATGTASSSRAVASAAQLAPTQVLLAGGFSGRAAIRNFSLALEGSVLNSAEVFDETTGGFSLAGNMATPRMGSTATALTNGKVLVAGGLDNHGNVLDSAELYDPTARKFSAVANPMSDRRMFHTATTLLSGKVLIAGGATNMSGDTTSSADIYDPTSNSFTAATFPMDHQRAAHTATLFPTGPQAGKVLLAGGIGGSSFFFKDSSAELYDPATQEFTLLSTFLNEPRALHTATLLDSGSVLLAGGFDGSVAVTGGGLSGASGLISNSAETFDPATGDFACVGGFNSETTRCNQSMTVARAGHSATLLATGPKPHRVLMAGGIGAIDPAAHGVELSSAELFNPAAGGSFSATGAMSTARALHTATLLR
ncbi:MAG TPA: kelch repeat-containing protein [Candidatus Acidoferrum sp.]|nr:kelch repeat-containing protein [Candidatus Acidoferrum sp.]